jgi:hypothetical protein
MACKPQLPRIGHSRGTPELLFSNVSLAALHKWCLGRQYQLTGWFVAHVSPAGLDPETLAVIWTMVDRHEPESPHAPFWSALPAHFSTGLSVSQGLVDVLRGLPLHLEMMTARAHVREQFQALQQTFQ